MQRLLEMLLGLERGFLAREGELALSFNPAWPWQAYVGAAAWNVALIAGGLGLVLWVYRREARGRGARITLGVMRAALVLLLIGLLNRPVVTLGQSRTEPSVLPILVDQSVSMRVKDVGDPASPRGRLESALSTLVGPEAPLPVKLRETHQLKFYRFDGAPVAVETLEGLSPVGQSTDVVGAVAGVLAELQGQRVAGVVLFTDGRDTPARNQAERLSQLASFGVKVFPVVVGSDRPAQNLAIQSVNVQDAAFVGDIVNVRVALWGAGYEPGHPAVVRLMDKSTGELLTDAEGGAVEQTVSLTGGGDAPAQEVELLFRPTKVGPLDVAVDVVMQPGEVDDEDNARVAQVAVLDAKINVLYVEGYPRWEYRYLKNEMIRDRTVEISCLLTSADPAFRQEGDRPITRFPESLNELLDYDVIVFGDVDPRQFSDFQLQLVHEFVSRLGGGFGMVAGPAFSPQAYRGTAIEPLLPVNIASAVGGEPRGGSITQGWRPVLTREGAASSIFRFFGDRAENERFLSEQIPPLFWYSRGVTVKPGVSEVYAEHPTDVGSDGRKAPLLVLGRFGAGRTLFSAIDDSWRWRYYTGETIFDTYWVQQLRHLARGRKLGQRQAALATLRPAYELGEPARISLRVLNPQLLPQLPEQIRVDILEEDGRTPVAQHMLLKQEGQPDLYAASFPADRVGSFVALVSSIAGGVDDLSVPFQVRVPRLELVRPQTDRAALARMATQTGGEVLELSEAGVRLPSLIPSAARVVPVETVRPLWDAPLVLILFVGLIVCEWVARKLLGMV